MPPAAIAAVGVVSQIAGGVAAKNAGAGAAGQANDAANVAYAKLQEIGLPPDEAKQIIYQQFHQAGIMTPELEQHIEQQASKMNDVQGSPDAQKAQMNALQILSQRGKGGLNPEDRAALNQVRNQIATDTEGKRQQILQNFQARGQAGSGAELIAALQGAQSGANAESQSGDRLAAMASQNALQAIGQAGTLGGQIEQQQFGEGAQKAQAQDVINQFNTQNQVQQQARNVGAQNQAQGVNLQNAQNIANANTTQANQELLRQKDAERQQWLDAMNRTQVQAGGANTLSNQKSALSQAQSASAAAPWQAIGAGASTIGSALMKKNQGGEIPHYDDGGKVQPEPNLADKLRDYFAAKHVQQQSVDPNKAAQVSQSFKSAFADGGQVKTPAEIAQDSMRKAFHFSDGGGVHQPDEHQRRLPVTDYRYGGHVDAPEVVSGDSPKNDIQPALLSGGEYVIKKTQAKSPFGKKLIKLLEAHSEVMKHAPKEDGE